ncbi:putative zinc finger protein [Calycina marina]|uniref:Zinc finger protein n=1 Tax=Calycina marina TaxID=1763456 RepID=A0A9P8CD00_9HELO|nr:putative zinc finger protein [Calycina marina]
MDSYRNREPARSPEGRPSWGGRDSYRDRGIDRGVERDDFYRGRSPGGDRRRPRDSRDRSRSPIVDRYEPGRNTRDDYDRARERDRDVRRRPSPAPPNIDRYIPGQDSGTPTISVNPLQDPVQLPFQVGFSYFGEWWRTNEKIKEEREYAKSGERRPIRGVDSQEDRDKEKAKIQAAYDAYKEELQARMAKIFVNEHKSEQWFRERYVPEIRDGIHQQLNEFRRGNYAQWEQDLETGTFDEFSLEGIPKNESNGAGGVIEKEEGETSAVNEVLGVGDLVPSRGSDIRDENAFQPTLLIKTISPSVNRDNLEAFCKQHLGEGEGGFKWLGLSDPNPSKRYHRIGWVMLHPAPSAEPTELKGEDEDGIMSPVIPQSTADKALEAINGKTVKDEVRGDFTCHVGIHNPPSAPRKKALWDLFSAPERVEKDLNLAQRLIQKYEEDFGSDFNAVLKIEERVEELRLQGRLTPPITSIAAKEEKKSASFGIEEGEEGEEVEEEDEGAVDDEVDDEDLLVKKKQLDLMVEYLRRVFNFCFFCVFESDSVHELTRKCPGGHLRRPRNILSTAGKEAAKASALGEPFPGKKRSEYGTDDIKQEEWESTRSRRYNYNSAAAKADQQLQRAFNWVKTFEDKILQLIEPESIDVRALGGEPIEDALKNELANWVKQEDEHKFRCKVPECTKLFKEEYFWKKHVEKRHPEWLENLKTELELLNTYVSDPSHIAPSRSDANSNGHFPPPNGHMPAGTPRGFNLQNVGMPPGATGGNFGFQPFVGGPAMFATGNDRNGGPMRRGGRAHQNNSRAGPYDRPGQQPRPGQQRWSDNGGRLSPTGGRSRGGGASASGGSRWDDGGATGTVPPREAVAGRSLRSYEDLDAVEGAGGGELNY